MSNVVEGEVAFSHLKSFEEYMGKSTEKYALTLTISEEDAKSFSDQGVKIKQWEGKSQRKFTSGRAVTIYNPDLTPWDGDEIPRGSKVRIAFNISAEPYGDFGHSVYVNQVQVVELAAGAVPAEFQPVEQPALAGIESEEEDIPF